MTPTVSPLLINSSMRSSKPLEFLSKYVDLNSISDSAIDTVGERTVKIRIIAVRTLLIKLVSLVTLKNIVLIIGFSFDI
jgi:hypothetical protein